ncbi:unnamed protein product (macronuclear) [Paramecium tetraurelia]|uniref:cholesterol 7-desaturase n=1 Tax=Paramecium tetraurelia TaxID=5888 RepID=A0C837_PARTE|nr:uncharacterized protein GSPATT00036085001 [Paramecium tetraurelia]CAK66954.1 unnamed protein product [Paramecium tetraurelia]|eukprot:XP_001434351.1 hypothetical protein (macronuclear) [Paramecium tetraurelia strain d4-2]
MAILSLEMVLTLTAFLLYYLYYKKFKFFTIVEKLDEKNIKNKLPRGKCPPSYPNGWYRLCRSGELQPGEVKEIKLCGRHIAYYRGTDKQVYAVAAYCPHMGANLGIGGQVKFRSCIECPFHGWTFDGKSGLCVNSEQLEPKIVTTYCYPDIERVTKNQKGEYIQKIAEGEVKIKTYLVKEVKGIVYVWLHSKEAKPWYDVVSEESDHLTLRAESINYVNCHIQEIPENGADMRHFDYIHASAMDIIPHWLDSDFLKEMTHPVPRCRQYQKQLFDQYFTNKELIPYLNVLLLDGYVILFNRFKFHAIWATGFQMGPSTVALYVKSAIFEVLFKQSIQPVEKFTQKVYHTVFTNGYLPYWFSAYLLHAELRQVLFDVKLWNAKIFSEILRYNLKTYSDQALLQWRQWYSQFYDGAAEFEKGLDKLEW